MSLLSQFASFEKAKEVQVGFLAMNKKGEYGAYALQKGFTYAVRKNGEEKIYAAPSHYNVDFSDE